MNTNTFKNTLKNKLFQLELDFQKAEIDLDAAKIDLKWKKISSKKFGLIKKNHSKALMFFATYKGVYELVSNDAFEFDEILNALIKSKEKTEKDEHALTHSVPEKVNEEYLLKRWPKVQEKIHCAYWTKLALDEIISTLKKSEKKNPKRK